jgi:hypothetical protein
VKIPWLSRHWSDLPIQRSNWPEACAVPTRAGPSPPSERQPQTGQGDILGFWKQTVYGFMNVCSHVRADDCYTKKSERDVDDQLDVFSGRPFRVEC